MRAALTPRAPLLAALVCALACAAATVPARAEEAPLERVKVADQYLELRTGPGRGYPVFFVAERDEWVEIELRHTDWFRVRTAGGKQGWVVREQIETTLTADGSQRTFRDVLLDDYLKRRSEFGAAWGRFKGEPMLKFWAGAKFSEAIGGEVTFGQVQGLFSGTDFWHVNLTSEPWADQRLSPFFGVGVGRFKNIPNPSLVSAIPTSAKLADASVGLRFHLSNRFVLRADYTFYTAFLSDTRNGEFRALTVGLSFFF
jgi:hypothetical protein